MLRSGFQRDLHSCVYYSVILDSNIWKQPKHPSRDEKIKKMWCVYTHTHNRLLINLKKREIFDICDIMSELREQYAR